MNLDKVGKNLFNGQNWMIENWGLLRNFSQLGKYKIILDNIGKWQIKGGT